jgi:hypothetical protein
MNLCEGLLLAEFEHHPAYPVLVQTWRDGFYRHSAGQELLIFKHRFEAGKVALADRDHVAIAWQENDRRGDGQEFETIRILPASLDNLARLMQEYS